MRTAGESRRRDLAQFRYMMRVCKNTPVIPWATMFSSFSFLPLPECLMTRDAFTHICITSSPLERITCRVRENVTSLRSSSF